jgi:hypothetical protein
MITFCKSWQVNFQMRLPCTETSESPGAALLEVAGRVENPLRLELSDIRNMESEEFQDLFIVCGTGTPVDTIKRCKGVLIEKIIQKANVIKADHNDTKKMYIVATALDGYQVVFSWQEIFNTLIGGGVAVLIERDGKPLCETADRIDLISSQDYYAGSRYVRDLRMIEICMVASSDVQHR